MELKKAKNKNQETYGYEMDKRPKTEKLKQKEIMLTENQKKLKQKKSRNAVRVSVKSVRRGARCLWRAGFKKQESFELGMEE